MLQRNNTSSAELNHAIAIHGFGEVCIHFVNSCMFARDVMRMSVLTHGGRSLHMRKQHRCRICSR